MPRPQDLVKIVIAPTVYVIGVAARGSFVRFDEFVSLWLILEFLIYHARYQLNDALGLAADRENPGRRLRGRLPVGASGAESRRSVRISVATAGGRLVLAAAIGWAIGEIGAVGILILTVFTITVMYECLRSWAPDRVRRTAGGREFAIWITVGFGYGLRSALGMDLAGTHSDEMVLLVIAFFSAVGTMYVTLSWALEATNFCAAQGSQWIVSGSLRRKPHISTLLKHIDGSRSGSPWIATSATISRTTPGYLGVRKVMNAQDATVCPWNVALFTSALLASALGGELAGLRPLWACAAVAALTVGGVFWLCVATSSVGRWKLAATVAVGLAVIATAAGASSSWAVTFPWLIMAACYAALRSASYVDSMRLPGLRTLLRPHRPARARQQPG